ncbi:hypothetical protein FHR32_005065 [Streptosporangium album]|uniref:Uncharacterized protein n=1 Tax=Streptosporangium album TaxID=47479 RepID=A0A7W7RZY8_9ACTN|nr:hypothetical protein [Streptosporangium album]
MSPQVQVYATAFALLGAFDRFEELRALDLADEAPTTS